VAWGDEALIDRFIQTIASEEGFGNLLAEVAVLGVGRINYPSAPYLAAAGVGSQAPADSDCIEVSNLNHQIPFTSQDLEWPKTVAEAERINALDPDIDMF
jgi:sulfur-carrier protein adenylyltransferase/sulfurtransferase